MRKLWGFRSAYGGLAIACLLLIFSATLSCTQDVVPSSEARPHLGVGDQEKPTFAFKKREEAVGLVSSHAFFGEGNLPERIVWSLYFSFACAAGSLITFAFTLYNHLRNYHEPKLQRMVCRIGCTMPVFAFASTAACISVVSQLKANEASLLFSGGTESPEFNSNQLESAFLADGYQPGREQQDIDPDRRIRVDASLENEKSLLFRDGSQLLSSEDEFNNREPQEKLHMDIGLLKRRLQETPFASEDPPTASNSAASTKRDIPSPYLKFYYQQQQLFFELLKQLTQSTALYSFMSLMIDACGRLRSAPFEEACPPSVDLIFEASASVRIVFSGGYRCLSLTLGCEGHTVPFVFPLNLACQPFRPSPRALRCLKLGVMQFVFVLPFWTGAQLVVHRLGGNVEWQAGSLLVPGGFFLPTNENNPFGLDAPLGVSIQDALQVALALVLSGSMFVSMLSLSQFYVITEPYLELYSPSRKFAMIQFLVFTNSWQRLAVAGLVNLRIVGVASGMASQQGIELYHNLLMNVWSLILGITHGICFPVSEHLPERDDAEEEAIVSDERKASLFNGCALLAFRVLDVFFSVDILLDAHQVVLSPQRSLDRAYSLLRRETARKRRLFDSATSDDRLEECSARRSSHTELNSALPLERPSSPGVCADTREDPQSLVLAPTHSTWTDNLRHSLEWTDSARGGESCLYTGEGSDLCGESKFVSCSSEVPLCQGSRTLAMSRESQLFSLWERGLSNDVPFSPRSCRCARCFSVRQLQKAEVSRPVSAPPSTLLPLVSGQSNALSPTSICDFSEVFVEAATVAKYRSAAARASARARFATLSSDASPYATNRQLALAIALGDSEATTWLSTNTPLRRVLMPAATASRDVHWSPLAFGARSSTPGSTLATRSAEDTAKGNFQSAGERERELGCDGSRGGEGSSYWKTPHVLGSQLLSQTNEEGDGRQNRVRLEEPTESSTVLHFDGTEE